MRGSRRKRTRGPSSKILCRSFISLRPWSARARRCSQALKIAAGQCESVKLRAVLDEITAKVSAGSTFHAAAASFPTCVRIPVAGGDPHRRGHRQDGPGSNRAQQADPRIARDQAQGQRCADVSINPGRRGRHRGDSHALAGRTGLRQDVQGYGCGATRRHPVCRRRLGFDRQVRPLRPGRHHRDDRRVQAIFQDRTSGSDT